MPPPAVSQELHLPGELPATEGVPVVVESLDEFHVDEAGSLREDEHGTSALPALSETRLLAHDESLLSSMAAYRRPRSRSNAEIRENPFL